MTVNLFFPHDDFNKGKPDVDLAADYLELAAYFAHGPISIVNEFKIGSRVRAVFLARNAVNCIKDRQLSLSTSYPFELSFDEDDRLLYIGNKTALGQTAYVLSLILSNLASKSDILKFSEKLPSDLETRMLRQYFQYFATAALAAEIHGRAWSFGFPRPDGSGFREKMLEISKALHDGEFLPHPHASSKALDDDVDIMAARLHRDRLPGFIFAVAQVATGNNWKEKSILGKTEKFRNAWFSQGPLTQIVSYMVIPFTRPKDGFFLDCCEFGNILHRLRVPCRVDEAQTFVGKGVESEAFSELSEAAEWIEKFSRLGS